jgi:hypothetical protein
MSTEGDCVYSVLYRFDVDERGESYLKSITWSNMTSDEIPRTSGPSYQRWEMHSGERLLFVERWGSNWYRHREGGQALLLWIIEHGVYYLHYECWDQNSGRHRIDGPAEQEWRIQNNHVYLHRELWFLKGKLHRDGFLPASSQGHYYKGGMKRDLHTLLQAGGQIRNILRVTQAKRKRRRLATMQALRNARCTVFPGLDNLIFQFI